MRKKLLAILLIFVFCPVIHAQRHADLKLKIKSPSTTDSTYIPPTQPYTLSLMVYNNGTDTLQLTDTIALYFIVGNDTMIWVNSGVIQKYAKYYDQIAPGDSFAVEKTMAFDQSFAHMRVDYCIMVKPLNYSMPITDSDLSDNQNCMNIIVDDKPSNIQVIGTKSGIRVYPNPVTNSFSIHGKDRILAYKMVDIEGREVDLVETNPGEFDCSKIPAGGLYLMTITTKQGIYTLKVVVSR